MVTRREATAGILLTAVLAGTPGLAAVPAQKPIRSGNRCGDRDWRLL